MGPGGGSGARMNPPLGGSVGTAAGCLWQVEVVRVVSRRLRSKGSRHPERLHRADIAPVQLEADILEAPVAQRVEVCIDHTTLPVQETETRDLPSDGGHGEISKSGIA